MAAPPPGGGSAAASEKPSSNASEVPTCKVGDKVRNNGYQFTVIKLSCGVRRVGDASLCETAAGQFCLVSLRVKNISKDPITFSSEHKALVDTKGASYSPDDDAWLYVDEDVDVTREINRQHAEEHD